MKEIAPNQEENQLKPISALPLDVTPRIDAATHLKPGKLAADDVTEKTSKVSALEELMKMGGGDDQALRLEQTAAQEKLLEKQLNERPLLHMQEELDKGESAVNKAIIEKKQDQENLKDSGPRQNLLKDDDVELENLEKHLILLHKSFYDEYEEAILYNKSHGVITNGPDKTSLNNDGADLHVVPDIGKIMPRLKAKTFVGCRIVTSGLVPLQTDIMKTELGIQASSFGAKIMHKVNRSTTHLVVSMNRTRTNKVRQAAKYPQIKIVNQDWLLSSISRWEKEEEEPFLIHIHEDDRIPEWKDSSSAPMSLDHPLDESDASLTDDESEYQVPNSNDEMMDGDSVMPSKMADEYSPVADLNSIDWREVDDELAEFMGEDSENDSDSSDSFQSASPESVPSKRSYDEMKDEEDGVNRSILAKKQKLANQRKTGLNEADYPQSIANSLTSKLRDEDINTESQGSSIKDEDDGDADASLEALIMAEFEKEEEEFKIVD